MSYIAIELSLCGDSEGGKASTTRGIKMTIRVGRKIAVNRNKFVRQKIDASLSSGLHIFFSCLRAKVFQELSAYKNCVAATDILSYM